MYFCFAQIFIHFLNQSSLFIFKNQVMASFGESIKYLTPHQ